VEEQTPYTAGKPAKRKYLEIRLTKCTLFLTEAELARLLAHEPATWQEAIRRGKAFLRKRQTENRMAHISEILPEVLKSAKKEVSP